MTWKSQFSARVLAICLLGLLVGCQNQTPPGTGATTGAGAGRTSASSQSEPAETAKSGQNEVKEMPTVTTSETQQVVQSSSDNDSGSNETISATGDSTSVTAVSDGPVGDIDTSANEVALVNAAEKQTSKTKAASKSSSKKDADPTSGGRYEIRADHDPDGIGKFYMGREIAHVMGFAGAPWLERPDREREEATSKMIEGLDLKPGMVVADIGAGSGVITLPMASRVAPGGKVIAVDVQQEMLDLLQGKLKLRKIDNVELLLGTVKSPRLEPESVDLAIMVDVYHELEFPYEMMQELSKALKLGGRVAFVEFRLEDPNVPIKLVHKMSQAQVKREIGQPGLNLRYRKTIDTLPWQHVIVFEKVGPDGGFKTLPDTQPETEKLSTPQEALAKIRVPEGFSATLFAAEPDVRQPIGITTDHKGRLWVAENYSYAESAVNFATSQHDRIVILEDLDGDGVHDRRKVFFDEARLLTSVEIGYGGVFALCSPQLMWIPDLDQDDIPDGPPIVLLDGFDDGAVRHNIVNGLKWGPDGWLYGRHGILATSNVGVPGATESQRTQVNCGIWRYHPFTRQFEVVAHGTTNPWGHDWDENGELFFINTVIGHLWHVIPGAHFRRMYGSDFNPRTYQLIEQTADHFHWDTREAWSDIRKGVTDTTSAAGGGHAHSGLMIYQGTNWPAEYRNSVLTVNLHGHRLNRDVLVREHAGYTAKHAADMVFFDDAWFRGVELIQGPDGSVFVADWSDIGECHENDGVHRGSGRIFKIAYGKGEKKGPVQDLGLVTSRQLSELVADRNEWTVRQAIRLLRERKQRGDSLAGATQTLTEIVRNGSDQHARLRALWAQWAIGDLDEKALLTILKDANENVQACGVKFLVDKGSPSKNAIGALAELARSTPHGLVLLHLAGAMQKLSPVDRIEIGLSLAQRGEFAEDRALPLMVWYGIEAVVPDLTPEQRDALLKQSQLPLLRRFIARRFTEEIDTRSENVVAVVELLKSGAQPGFTDVARIEMLSGMSEALRGWRKAPAPSNWGSAAENLALSSNPKIAELTRDLSAIFGDGRAVDELKAIVGNAGNDPATRRQALRSLAEARADGLAALCHQFLSDRAVDSEAIRALVLVDHPENAVRILNVYPRLDPETRLVAVDTLVARTGSANQLLEAIAAGKVRRQDVSAYHARQIRSLGDESLVKKLTEVWGDTRETAADKAALVAKFKELLKPDALAAADLSAGRALFNKTCATCHVLYGQGKNAGPDLTGGNRKNLDYLLENVVDPNSSVATDFRMSVLALKDGRVLNGVVVEKLDKILGIQTQTERVYVARDEIDEMKATEVSLMPEGLLGNLSSEEVRDLIAYLQSTRQVPLPE